VVGGAGDQNNAQAMTLPGGWHRESPEKRAGHRWEGNLEIMFTRKEAS